MSPTIHQFVTTGEAYDACQCYDEIKKGDILLITDDCVVGIADTWPVAVTVKRGHLHRPAEGITLLDCLDGRFNSHREVIDFAKKLAQKNGWEVIV